MRPVIGPKMLVHFGMAKCPCLVLTLCIVDNWIGMKREMRKGKLDSDRHTLVFVMMVVRLGTIIVCFVFRIYEDVCGGLVW